MIILEPDVIEWAINLATNLQNLATPRRGRRSRSQSVPRANSPRPRQREPPVPVIPFLARSPRNPPGTPHPRRGFPIREQSSFSGRESSPEINRPLRRTRPVLYPSLNPPPPSLAFIPPENTHATVVNPPTFPNAHLPDSYYVSPDLPTCSPEELRILINHCQLLASQSAGREIVYTHPLHEIGNFSSSPLHFVSLLWKYRVIITSAGIIEDYRRITRITRIDNVDRAALEKAYTIYLPWAADSWSVSVTHTNEL